MSTAGKILAQSSEIVEPVTGATAQCFHCGRAIADGPFSLVEIDGIGRPMCCRQCAGAGQAIADHGLIDFYKHRQGPAQRPAAPVSADPDALGAFDDRELQKSFVAETEEGVAEAHLILEGVACAACIRLIETRVSSLRGIRGFDVNYSTRRARARWDTSQLKMSEILGAIAELGYKAHPYDAKHRQAILEKERKNYLQRIGLAALCGMQVMMIAVALYIGDWSGMEHQYRTLFHWASLVLTLPIVAYSAQPFFSGAYRDLRAVRVGMDVPITIGISIAFIGSLWATVMGGPQVYYDSVAMLVLLLLGSRYLEMRVRQVVCAQVDEIERIVPAVATRISVNGADQRYEVVPVVRLGVGDCILVKPGEIIPVDGVVVAGCSSVDESLVTGESTPVSKDTGAELISGSTNIESPLQLIAKRVGADMVISQIHRLVETAQHEKPRITQIANRIASWFVAGVLTVALAVAIYWWNVEPAMWIPITVAVLVVSCPCALSIATPAAVTAATSALLKNGVATVNTRAIETLSSANHFVFDKTGTLTRGILSLRQVKASGADEQAVVAIAKALAGQSEHPTAYAILQFDTNIAIPHAVAVRNYPGRGVRGRVEGIEYFLGSASFIADSTEIDRRKIDDFASGEAMKCSLLADGDTVLAVFYFEDQLRPGARELIQSLVASRMVVSVMSGDHQDAVASVAAQLGVADYWYALRPEDKLARLVEFQDRGQTVVMVGDGINDAPVLAAAHVSVAMDSGTDLARLSSDMILLNPDLNGFRRTIDIAHKTRRIIKQNLAWAVLYNALAIPAAAAGYVTPWMAAIGMSLSSILVVANARRISG